MSSSSHVVSVKENSHLHSTQHVRNFDNISTKAKNQEQCFGTTKEVKMDPASEDVNTMAGNLLLTCSHVLSC